MKWCNVDRILRTTCPSVWSDRSIEWCSHLRSEESFFLQCVYPPPGKIPKRYNSPPLIALIEEGA